MLYMFCLCDGHGRGGDGGQSCACVCEHVRGDGFVCTWA
jgi:hypothetical protein